MSGGCDAIKQLIIQKKFLFAGRILAGRGIDNEECKSSLSNCYVLSVKDSIEGIYDCCKEMARTYSYGGGVGIDITPLSPRGAKVRNSAKESSGAVSFMDTFSQVTAQIGQSGRRGALMISMSCEHPDIEEFIALKEDIEKCTKANTSIRVTDRFMQAVVNHEDFELYFTRKETGEVITKTVNASDLFDKIARCNWDMGEPGVLFWDRIESYNLLSEYEGFSYGGVNPCAEEPLPPYGACLLGSINLAEFVDDHGNFDHMSFIQAINIIVVGMNDVLDEGIEKHPLEQQKEVARNYRQIGIGIMGLADMLIKIGIKYGSQESIDFCDSIGKTLIGAAIEKSSLLGARDGSFPMFDAEPMMKSSFYIENMPEGYSIERGMMNSQLLTCAPTGTLSTMLGISGGLEPIYANSYTRKTESLHSEDVYYKVYTPIVDRYMHENGIADEADLPEYFVTAKDIDYHDRIKMQAAWQKHIDASISSTVNVPEDFTVEQVRDLYIEAWRAGLKGVTVFRAGCKRAGVLTTDKPDMPAAASVSNEPLPRGYIIQTANDLVGKKRKLITGCVDSETEFFNGYRWKKISEYEEGDLVLQYNKDGTANLVKPLQYIKKPSKGLYHFKIKYGLDMMVSPDHRNVTFNHNLQRPKIITTDDIIKCQNEIMGGFRRKFRKSFLYSGDGIGLTDEEIRISIAIFADGCFYSPTSKKCMISVIKKRKRDRLVALLESAKIDFTERLDSEGYYNIKFYPPIEGKQKLFPASWYMANKHQLKVIFDEVFQWDGYRERGNQYTTANKENADFIQFVCSALGKSSSIYKDRRKQSICYRVDWSNRVLRSIIESKKKTIPFIQPEDGFEYCFSVESTMLVLRRNDCIFVTGNCGSLYCSAWFDPATGDLMETFLDKGSTGGCMCNLVAISRMMSLAARGGICMDAIIDQLESGWTCPSYAVRSACKHDTSRGVSCPSAVGNAIKEMHDEMMREVAYDEDDDPASDVEAPSSQSSVEQCPSCKSPLVHEGGCKTCRSCGWSKCD